MKKWIFFSSFYLFVYTCSSQVPGYQGKKFSMNYSGEFMNAISNPNANFEKGATSFNYTSVFSPEYTLSKRTNLCLLFKMSNSAFQYYQSIQYTTNSGGQLVENYFNPSDLYGDLRIKSYGLGLKIFSRSYIAPLGTFVKPEIYLLTYKVIEPSESKMAENCDSYDYLATTPSEVVHIKNNSPYKTLGLGFEVGANRILFNRVILSYGVTFGLIFNKETNVEYDEDNYYSITPLNRITNGGLLNFKIGIGSLLF